MELLRAIENRRSVRKFQQEPISKETLLKLVDFARLSASPANLQPLRYCIIHSATLVKEVHPLTRWAAYLPDYPISDTERPTAYIVVLGDKNVASKFEYDAGAATTTIMLAAQTFGLGSCCIGNIERKKLAELCRIDLSRYVICYLLAIGIPAQNNRAYNDSSTVKYSIDENGCFLVPKCPLEEVIIESL